MSVDDSQKSRSDLLQEMALLRKYAAELEGSLGNGAALGKIEPPMCGEAQDRVASAESVGILRERTTSGTTPLPRARKHPTEQEWAAERGLLEEMVSSHERNHRLIAYEIHDGLVQDMTGALMQLDALLQSSRLPAGAVRDQVRSSADLVRRALAEARQVISGLQPPILDELGLVAAIEHRINDPVRNSPRIDLEAEVKSEHWDPLIEATLYRIALEAVTNIRRHAKTDRATIRLVEARDRIQMEIRDWGVGFIPDSIGGEHIGLQGIRERARLLRGRAVIESSPGQGTRVFVDLPVANLPRAATFSNDRSIE